MNNSPTVAESSAGPVLIGFADAVAAPEVAWSLVEAGFKVIAFSRRGKSCGLRWSRFVKMIEVTSPEQDLSACMTELQQLITELQPCTFFALDDHALWIAAEIGRQDPALTLACGSEGNADFALDKRRQIRAAQEAGILVPSSVFVSQRAEIQVDRIIFPIIFKPALAARVTNGKLGRGGAYFCNDIEELERAFDLWQETEPMILQQIVHGTGHGVFGLVDHGKVLGLVGHERVRMMNPHGSGSSACRSADVDPDLADRIHRMLTGIGWRGLFMVEMLRDDQGNSWFMEVNGRPWGSLALARRCGFEFPAWSVQQALGLPLSPASPKFIRHRLCRHLGREFIHVLMVIKGPKSAAVKDWPSVGKTLLNFLTWSPSQSWYNFNIRDPLVFFADAGHTVLSQVMQRRRNR